MEEKKEEEKTTEKNDFNNEKFLNNMNSILSVKRNYEKKVYDYEWIGEIEEALPYIDNILRNPKRFIMNDEEIVKVELAKKITVESVIHLSQHTNLIQDIDKKTGDVKPSKILNINKEESLDTYENRFIFTLINNLILFYNTRAAATGENSFYSDQKNIKYEANTKVNNENVNISLNINSLDKNIIEMDRGKSGLTISDRLKKIKQQLDGYTQSELYKSLDKLHVSPVRSPIRKTNVILKNPNFQKAVNLWNYIQSYEDKNEEEADKKDYLDTGELRNEYDQTFLMNYIANRVLSEKATNASPKRVVEEMITRLIDTIMDSDDEITEDKIKELFDEKIKYIKDKNNSRTKTITNIFLTRIAKEEEDYQDLLLKLKKEG